MSQFVLGLDIGYSNLKMAMGYKGEEARTVVILGGGRSIGTDATTVNWRCRDLHSGCD